MIEFIAFFVGVGLGAMVKQVMCCSVPCGVARSLSESLRRCSSVIISKVSTRAKIRLKTSYINKHVDYWLSSRVRQGLAQTRKKASNVLYSLCKEQGSWISATIVTGDNASILLYGNTVRGDA